MGHYKNLKEALKNPDDCTVLKLSVKGARVTEDLTALPRLQELYLEGAALTELPDVAALRTLRLFSLRAPAFRGSLAPLFHLARLENLKAIDTPLEPLLLPLGEALAPLRTLTLKNAGLRVLPLELGEYGSLEELYLPENDLAELPFTFGGLKALKRLNLDHNAFARFPDLLGGLPRLQHVSIDHNPFDEDERSRIQRQFHLTVQ
jgi:leucine-rich repeat protein SHOC2